MVLARALGTGSASGQTIYKHDVLERPTTGIALKSNFTARWSTWVPEYGPRTSRALTLRMNGPASRVDLGWAGQRLNLSVLMQAPSSSTPPMPRRNQTCICNGRTIGASM